MLPRANSHEDMLVLSHPLTTTPTARLMSAPRYDVYLFVCLSVSLSHSVCLSLLLFVRSSNVAVRLRQSIGLCVCQCAPLSVCFYLSRSLSLSHSLSLCRYAPMSVCSPLI